MTTAPLLIDLYCGAGGACAGYQRVGFRVLGIDNRKQPRYPGEFLQMDALEFLRRYLAGEYERAVAMHASPPCQAHTALRSMPTARIHADLIPETRELLTATGLPYVIENVEGAPLRFPARLCGTSFGLGTGDAELRRHRWFESNWAFLCPPCEHGRRWQSLSVTGTGNGLGGRSTITVCGEGGRDYAKEGGSVISIHGGHVRDRRQEQQLATITIAGHGGDPRRHATDRPQAQTVAVDGHSGGHSTRSGRRLFSVEECREAMGIPYMTQAELSQAIPPAYCEYIGRQLRDYLR